MRGLSCINQFQTIQRALSSKKKTFVSIQYTRRIYLSPTTSMPLVVPGINSGGDNKQAEWMNKLMGKKIGDTSDSTVSRDRIPPSLWQHSLIAIELREARPS